MGREGVRKTVSFSPFRAENSALDDRCSRDILGLSRHFPGGVMKKSKNVKVIPTLGSRPTYFLNKLDKISDARSFGTR